MSAAAETEGPLAMICGGGTLPLAVADSVAARGRKVLLFPLRGFASAADFAGREATWMHFGQLGTVARIARAQGAQGFGPLTAIADLDAAFAEAIAAVEACSYPCWAIKCFAAARRRERLLEVESRSIGIAGIVVPPPPTVN